MNQIEKQVIELLADQTGYPQERITMDTSIIDDLGVAGDDADELFQAFDERFGTNSQRIDYLRFFGHEGVYPWTIFVWLFILLWGLFRLLAGKTFSKKRKQEEDMKVSDFVETVVSKKWNTKFEQGDAHNSGGSAPSIVRS